MQTSLTRARSRHTHSSNRHSRLLRAGVRVLKADRHSTKRGTGRRHWGVYEAVHDATGAARDEIEKARKFASMYSRSELKELCTLGGSRGRRLNKSHVIRLLGVANKRRRAKLARLASEQGWSVRRLSDEIRGRSEAAAAASRKATLDSTPLGHSGGGLTSAQLHRSR